MTSFLEKIRHFPEVHFITSINSVRNLVVTGTNLLKKHQIKNICFSLNIQLLTREKPWIFTDLKNRVKQIM